MYSLIPVIFVTNFDPTFFCCCGNLILLLLARTSPASFLLLLAVTVIFVAAAENLGLENDAVGIADGLGLERELVLGNLSEESESSKEFKRVHESIFFWGGGGWYPELCFLKVGFGTRHNLGLTKVQTYYISPCLDQALRWVTLEKFSSWAQPEEGFLKNRSRAGHDLGLT